MNRRLVAFLFSLLSLALVRADDPKNHDLDVNYDEARILPFEWPSSLVSTSGKSVTTPVEWFQQRRPELLSLFGNLIYGTVPMPESPIQVTYSVVKTNRDFLGRKAIRKDIRIQFENARGKAEMLVLVFVPSGGSKPVPAMMLHTFDSTHGDAFDAHPDRPGYLRNGIPLAEILGHGLAFVAVFQGDLVGHNEVEFRKGIHPLFYRGGQSFPKASEWGCISAVAWGGSRALDYLEKDPDIDAHRVALVGHSKMGKTTLWTAAQDDRFAIAISAQSGCGGAAPWRRKYGETLEKLVTRFPYWLCRNAGKFVNNERDLPVDQHMLIACIAPRPVYICVAVDDRWADPLGEYQAAYQAGDVYRLLGKKPLETATPPPVGEAIVRSDVGYHCREGGHSVDLFDWQQFLAFTDYHFHSK